MVFIHSHPKNSLLMLVSKQNANGAPNGQVPPVFLRLNKKLKTMW